MSQAIVTGGASGIGEACARRLAADGFHVAVVDVDEAGALRVAGEISGDAYVVDVSDSAQVKSAYDKIAAKGAVEVMLNCAGIGGGEETQHSFEISIKQGAEAAKGKITTVMDTTMIMTDDQWHRMLGVHLDGTFFWTRTVLPGMVERGKGSIINISSIDGMIGASGLSHYCAAKAGILGLTRAVAREVAGAGVKVNAIAPGFVNTPVYRKFFTAEMTTALELQTPMGRVADPSEIASVVSFLSSADSSFITGQTISPNGGMVIC